MNYIVTPSNDDILHYAKGTESKAHKYVSRVMKNGKWVYTYAKNRLRGNKVTNKDAKKYGPYGGKLQYNPTVKTGEDGVLREPTNTKVYLKDTRTAATVSDRPDWDTKIKGVLSKPVTNVSAYRDIFDKYTGAIKGDNQYSPSNQAINTRTRGTAYTPQNRAITTASRGTAYTPQNRAINTASRGTAYVPQNRAITTSSRGTSYTPSLVKTSKRTTQAPVSVMGYTHTNIGGSSHSFGKDFTDKTYDAGKKIYDNAVQKYIDSKSKKDEKKRELLSNKNKEPSTVLGTTTYSGKKKQALVSRKGSHTF